MNEDIISMMVDDVMSGCYPVPRVTHNELVYAAMNSEAVEDAYIELRQAIIDEMNEIAENRADPYGGKYM